MRGNLSEVETAIYRVYNIVLDVALKQIEILDAINRCLYIYIMIPRLKPLGHKSYGSIPHLIGSRRGPRDYGVNEGQQRICCERARDKHDEIIVQEKLDGANVSAALVGGEVLALTRSGTLAAESDFAQHVLFADWVAANQARFRAVLREKERLAGEWLALAHGTIYDLPHEPFVAFDLMTAQERTPFDEFTQRLNGDFVLPRLLHRGGPLSVEAMLERLEPSGHGAQGLAEGAVWRVERWIPQRKKKVVDFLAKYVRPEKVDGLYLPKNSDETEKPFRWLWRPDASE